eukprot:TRINITY_DN41890_c0_g1_i1.p1 TRINITY_DN41890_c0_g1~~TRINITY_DN41890_c0_g1_i1.p1  ORF type:complete len:229 (+),score=48.42 TRINITY_DN41890_c0_g1_i1:142-828(+)
MADTVHASEGATFLQWPLRSANSLKSAHEDAPFGSCIFAMPSAGSFGGLDTWGQKSELPSHAKLWDVTNEDVLSTSEDAGTNSLSNDCSSDEEVSCRASPRPELNLANAIDYDKFSGDASPQLVDLDPEEGRQRGQEILAALSDFGQVSTSKTPTDSEDPSRSLQSTSKTSKPRIPTNSYSQNQQQQQMFLQQQCYQQYQQYQQYHQQNYSPWTSYNSGNSADAGYWN